MTARDSIIDAIEKLRAAYGQRDELAARIYLAAQVAIAKAARR
jgi:hypothetical protein